MIALIYLQPGKLIKQEEPWGGYPPWASMPREGGKCKSTTAPKLSTSTCLYFSPLKLTLKDIPVSTAGVLLPALVKVFFPPGLCLMGHFSKKCEMTAVFSSDGATWSGTPAFVSLSASPDSSICRAVIKAVSLLCVLLVYTNHVRSINHGILKCNRLCKEY